MSGAPQRGRCRIVWHLRVYITLEAVCLRRRWQPQMTLMSKLTTADDLPGLPPLPSFTTALFTPSPQAAATSAAAVAIDARSKKLFTLHCAAKKQYGASVGKQDAIEM